MPLGHLHTSCVHAFVIEGKREDGGPRIVRIGDEEMTLGRARACTVRLFDSGVSRSHARLVREDGRCVLYDVGAKNRVYVNGESVRRHELANGDVVLLGSSRLRFVSAEDDEALDRLGRVHGVASLGGGGGAGTGAVAARFEVRHAGLIHGARLLAEVPDPIDSLDELAAAFAKTCAAARATILLAEHGAPVVEVGHPVGDALSAGLMEAGLAATEAYDLIGDQGAPHLLVVPLQAAGNAYGFVALTRPQDDFPFDPQDRQLAGALAAHLATRLQRL